MTKTQKKKLLTMKRDISKRAFLDALQRRGIRPDYFGYFNLSNGTLVYARNGGDTYRHQLAYLIHQQERVNDSQY